MRPPVHSNDQAFAIALNALRRKRAEGGSTKSAKAHTGPIHSAVAGRTDHLPVHLPSGSYVFPADAVAHLGEDNTLAGFKILSSMFRAPNRTSGTPYGETGLPYRAPEPNARGGASKSDGEVPIVGAGGEYAADPEGLRDGMARLLGLPDLSLDDAHKIADEFVVQLRKRHIDTLKKLPPPKKD